MLFVIKPTAACNGACIYCSAYKEHPDELAKMSPDELGVVLARIEEYVAKARPRRASILWHGGEPLVMGASFYRDVLERCRKIKERTGIELRHIMQSNITLVTDELVEVLKELLSNQRIGSSYDPVEGVRLLKGGRSYEELWKRGFEKLREAGIGVGVVYVAHKRSLGRAAEIYAKLKGLGLDGGLRFNPLYSAGLARDSDDLHISPREWGQFLLDLWDAWNEEGRSLRIDPLLSWEGLATGRSARITCAFSGRCTYNFTGIKPDGSIYSCGRSLDEGLMSFGNLNDKPLEEVFESDRRKAFLYRQEWLLQGECAGCRWWSFCHGGCPNDAHLGHGDMMRKTYWCEGRKLFLDKTFGHLSAVGSTKAPRETEDLFDEPVGDGR